MNRMHCRTCDTCARVIPDLIPYESIDSLGLVCKGTKDFCSAKCLDNYTDREHDRHRADLIPINMRGYTVYVLADPNTGRRIF